MKLNSGVRNSSQANRTMASQTAHTQDSNNNKGYNSQLKQLQANADTGVSAVKTSASGSINPSSRAPRVQTATGGRSKRFQDHLSKNFSNDSNTNTNATTSHAKRNAAYRISTGPQQNSSLTRAGATYGANARRKSQKIQFAVAGNQTQPMNQ